MDVTLGWEISNVCQANYFPEFAGKKGGQRRKTDSAVSFHICCQFEGATNSQTIW